MNVDLSDAWEVEMATPSHAGGVTLVTVDVEPDNVWEVPLGTGLTNVKSLPAFHRLCRRWGIRPTYLITLSVAQNATSAKVIETLLKDGCEVGVHSHLWEVPLRGEAAPISGFGPTGLGYSDEVVASRLTAIISCVKERFGPIASHRAGRFGIDTRQMRVLSSAGIQVDTSFTPWLDWRSAGGPNHSRTPDRAVWVRAGGSSRPILEIPCTIRRGSVPSLLDRGWISKVSQRLGLGPSWLRVRPHASPSDLRRLTQWAVDTGRDLNLMTHSSELCAGTSPYWKDQASIDLQMAAFEELFRSWASLGIPSKTLSERQLDFTESRHSDSSSFED